MLVSLLSSTRRTPLSSHGLRVLWELQGFSQGVLAVKQYGLRTREIIGLQTDEPSKLVASNDKAAKTDRQDSKGA